MTNHPASLAPEAPLPMVSGFGALANQQFMSLTTFRKDGRAVPTPVWFAEVDGRLYVTTTQSTGKIKRIRNNGRVTVAPCTQSGKVTGPAAEAIAQELIDPADAARAETALRQKYKLMRVLFNGLRHLFAALRRQPPTRAVYLRIDPA